MDDKGSVTGKIAHYIKDKIESGEWGIGDKISGENQICQELSVSRVSVRRAIKEFTSLGILESVRGKGTFVVSNDLSVFSTKPSDATLQEDFVGSILDFTDFRTLVEPAVCRRVAENPTPELIARLTELVGIMQASIGNNERFTKADTQYHLELCNAYGNPLLTEIMTGLFRHRESLADVNILSFEYYGGLFYHNLILECIKNKNGKKAEAMMLEHLTHGVMEMKFPEN